MFNTVIDQVKAVRGETEVVIVKLGTVTALSGGKAQVKLYGDNTASTKLYQYIDGYLPQVNDKVALLPQGKTYIILGKITDAAPVEKYATKDYVDGIAEGLLPIEYKNKLEDGNNTFTLTGTSLLPGSNNSIKLGASDTQFSAIYSKEFYENGVRLRADGILVVNSGTTYSLLLSYASSTATLTPSADNTFALGTSARKFKEAWLGLFRGTWKSGQSTERQLAWNSSNALVTDSNEAVDLGTSSVHFKDAYLRRMIGTLAYSSSSGTIGWASATVLQPSANNSIELGASSRQFNAVYTNKLYLNGAEFDPSGTTVDKLTTKYSNTNYTLTLSVKNGGASSQYEELTPSVNGKFDFGNSSYFFRYIYFLAWHNGTYYLQFNSSNNLIPSTTNQVSLGTNSNKYKNIYGASIYGDDFYGAWRYTANGRSVAWDSSNNIIPDTTNQVSLGTSSKQYKNVYGQNLYVNGTAVTSDKRLKEDIRELEEKHLAFFRCLRPVQFKYKDGESGRTHTGFIAQEVEDAIHEAGMTNQDMAVVVIDQESGRHYLRYEEIIAVQTQVIQNMQKKVDSLEARLAKLEALLERSTK